MTPRERVLKAMQLQHPDRVPLMCQFSFGFINQQLKESGISPMEVWMDAHKYIEALLILRDRYNFDGILVSVHGHYENWKSQIENLETVNGLEVATYTDRRETYLDDDLPSAEFFNKELPDISIIDVDQLSEEIKFMPAARDCHGFIDPNNPFLAFDLIDEKVKGKYSIHGEVISPFDYLLDLLGYENALLALLLEPDKCKLILQRFTNGLLRLVDGMCKKNIDAIKISSPFAGMGFISPEQYIEFEQPFIKQMAERISSNNKFGYIHTCGHINDRLEKMKETGISGLECLDPPPIGNVNLKDAFDRIGSELFIKGNIDPVNTLYEGSKESILSDVIERLNIGMKNPGFIFSSACSIAPKTPTENVRQLVDIIEEHGYYP
jgi:uroporphyrinogen-III decarboxylase